MLNQGNPQHTVRKTRGCWAQLDSRPGVGAGPQMRGLSATMEGSAVFSSDMGAWRGECCSECHWPGWLEQLPIQVVQVFGQTGGEASWEMSGKFQKYDEFSGGIMTSTQAVVTACDKYSLRFGVTKAVHHISSIPPLFITHTRRTHHLWESMLDAVPRGLAC